MFSPELNTLNAFYTVNTTNGATILPGMVQISADTRDTANVTVAADQRYRNILIKELVLSGTEDKLKPILLAKLYSLAAEQFKEFMDSTGRTGRTVDQNAYTVDGLLRFYSTEAKSGRMTKESVLEWFDSSATRQFINGKNPAAVAGYRENYAKLASPNHGVNPNTCTALLAVIQDSDTTHPVCAAIATKMQATIDKANKSVLADIL